MDSDLKDLDLYGIFEIQQTATEKEVSNPYVLTTYIIINLININLR